MKKGIVSQGNYSIIVGNTIVGDFDVGIEIDDGEGCSVFGNNINVRTAVRNATKAPFGRKVGRNEKCPCKSGLKYKKCCGGA